MAQFSPTALRQLVADALGSLPANASPEAALARVHRRLRERWPDQILPDLRWSLVSAAYGTQTVAPLYVSATEYLAFTGAALPTGGESGRFLASIEDHVLAGEIDVAGPTDLCPRRIGAGGVHRTEVGAAYTFAIPQRVIMLEHVQGLVPSMFLLPIFAVAFGTLNLPSLLSLVRNALCAVTFRWWGAARPRWRNWLGNQRACPLRIARPTQAAEVAELIVELREQRAAGRPVVLRPFGTSHSWSALVNTDAVMVDTRRLDRLLSIDRDRHQITVEPGLRLRTLIEAAWREGWRLPSVTAILSLTVGGMLSVGAHGTGKHAATFSDDVVSITFLNGMGEEITVDERDEDALRAARISLGALGVIIRFTVQCKPSGLFVYRPIVGDHARFATQAQLDALRRENELVELYWFPYINRAIAMTWNPVEVPPPDLPFFGNARRAWAWVVQNVGQFIIGGPIAFLVDRVLPRAAPVLTFLSSLMISRSASVQAPPDAGHYLHAYHTVRDSGWAVPADQAAAALQAYADEIARYKARGHYPANLCVHLRFLQSGDSLLGFDLNKGAPICQIEVATTARADEGTAFLRDMERRFLTAEFCGRPHWAKEWWLDLHPFVVHGRAAWLEFQSWRQRYDPEGLFANALIRGIDADVACYQRFVQTCADPEAQLRAALSDGKLPAGWSNNTGEPA